MPRISANFDFLENMMPTRPARQGISRRALTVTRITADIKRMATMTPPNPFSAADSALGYLYQVRVALLWALRRLKSGNDFLISLETLDDVTFETRGGAPEELLQTKHHRNREAVLTDASEDLWKSLRVWLEGYQAKTIPAGTALHLLTTAKAPQGSVAAYLRADAGRNVDAALKGLESTAQSSASRQMRPHTRRFWDTSQRSRANC